MGSAQSFETTDVFKIGRLQDNINYYKTRADEKGASFAVVGCPHEGSRLGAAWFLFYFTRENNAIVACNAVTMDQLIETLEKSPPPARDPAAMNDQKISMLKNGGVVFLSDTWTKTNKQKFDLGVYESESQKISSDGKQMTEGVAARLLNSLYQIYTGREVSSLAVVVPYEDTQINYSKKGIRDGLDRVLNIASEKTLVDAVMEMFTVLHGATVVDKNVISLPVFKGTDSIALSDIPLSGELKEVATRVFYAAVDQNRHVGFDPYTRYETDDGFKKNAALFLADLSRMCSSKTPQLEISMDDVCTGRPVMLADTASFPSFLVNSLGGASASGAGTPSGQKRPMNVRYRTDKRSKRGK